MIHLLAVRELMDHDELDGAETQPPLLPVSRRRGLENELYDFPCIEISTQEFPIGFVFFECGDREVVGGHNRVADCGDAFEEVLREGGVWAGKGFDECDARGRLRVGGIEALDADRHDGDGREKSEVWSKCTETCEVVIIWLALVVEEGSRQDGIYGIIFNVTFLARGHVRKRCQCGLGQFHFTCLVPQPLRSSQK